MGLASLVDKIPGIWRERLIGWCLGALMFGSVTFLLGGGCHPNPVPHVLPDGGVVCR